MNILINIMILSILMNYPQNRDNTVNISYVPLAETPKMVYPHNLHQSNYEENDPPNPLINSLNKIAINRETSQSQLAVTDLINENFVNCKYRVIRIAANDLNSPFGISSLGVEYSDFPIIDNQLEYHPVYSLTIMWTPPNCPLNIFPVNILYRFAPNLMLSYLNLFSNYQYKYESNDAMRDLIQLMKKIKK